MKKSQKKNKIWIILKKIGHIILNILKRIGQLILTVWAISYLSRMFNFVAIKLDDIFIFSKCLDCLPWFYFILNYVFFLLCLIGFIRLIILAKRKVISKFWIFDGLIGLIVAALGSFSYTVYFTHNLIKYPNALPVVLRVFPSDQTYVFYEGQIPLDKQKTLTGFVIQKDNPIPLRYENGKIQEFESKTDKWYSADDIEYSEDRMNALHKTTREPVTGFVMSYGQGTNVLLEYLNGKFTGNRFAFTKEDGNTTGKLSLWFYMKGGFENFATYEQYYPNGYLMIKSKLEKGKAKGDWYLPNGQLVLRTINQNFDADSPVAGVSGLQQTYYNTKGELDTYLDMIHGVFLCVSPDGKGRRGHNVDRYFNETEKFLEGKIPEFRCE